MPRCGIFCGDTVKIGMKKTTLYICIFLLFPLVVNFSQAAEIRGMDCTHCNEQLHAKADCCSMEKAAQLAKELYPMEKPMENCPHGGMCQGGEFIPNVMNSISALEFSISVPVVESIVYTLPAYKKQIRSREPPPQEHASSLFLFHCVFLI